MFQVSENLAYGKWEKTAITCVVNNSKVYFCTQKTRYKYTQDVLIAHFLKKNVVEEKTKTKICPINEKNVVREDKKRKFVLLGCASYER